MAAPEIHIIPSDDTQDNNAENLPAEFADYGTGKRRHMRAFSSGSSADDDASMCTLSPRGDDVMDDITTDPFQAGVVYQDDLGYSPSAGTGNRERPHSVFRFPPSRPRRHSDCEALVSDPTYKEVILSLRDCEERSGVNADGSSRENGGRRGNTRRTAERRRSLPHPQVYSVQEEISDSTLSVKSAPISPLGRMATRNFFENKLGLAEDLKFISRMPELCDVTFLVGDRREPVCAVRAILAARSRVFHKLLYSGTVTPSSSPRRRANSMESRFARKTVSFLTRSKSNGDPDGGNNATKCPRTVIIDEFEPAVFFRLVDYCHTGCVVLNAETVLGLMNAADYYGLDELRRACIEYMHGCLDLSTVCLLLASAEKYIQYKATKSLVQRALEFVDEHGEDVLGFPAFLKLPQHVVRLILSRDELQADELTKFRAALAWSTLHFRNTPGTSIKGAMAPFIDTIAFHLIPATDLMQEVRDSAVVPDQKIMTALAFQADPGSVDARSLSATPNRVRLSMLSLSLDDHSQSMAGDAQSAAETERTDLSDDEASDDYLKEAEGRDSPAKSPEFRRLSTVDSDDGQGGNRIEQTTEVRFDNTGRIPSRRFDSDPSRIFECIPDNHDYHFKLNLHRPQSADELSTANSLSNFDSMSMSTSSDVTDSSSAGGSFGRADQKTSVHSSGTKSPIPGMTT